MWKTENLPHSELDDEFSLQPTCFNSKNVTANRSLTLHVTRNKYFLDLLATPTMFRFPVSLWVEVVELLSNFRGSILFLRKIIICSHLFNHLKTFRFLLNRHAFLILKIVSCCTWDPTHAYTQPTVVAQDGVTRLNSRTYLRRCVARQWSLNASLLYYYSDRKGTCVWY